MPMHGYLTKPVRFDAFEALVKSINDFRLTKVELPPQLSNASGTGAGMQRRSRKRPPQRCAGRKKMVKTN